MSPARSLRVELKSLGPYQDMFSSSGNLAGDSLWSRHGVHVPIHLRPERTGWRRRPSPVGSVWELKHLYHHNQRGGLGSPHSPLPQKKEPVLFAGEAAVPAKSRRSHASPRLNSVNTGSPCSFILGGEMEEGSSCPRFSKPSAFKKTFLSFCSLD